MTPARTLPWAAKEEGFVEQNTYMTILDSMPDAGVYVIKADDRSILYLNRRAREAFPDARPGMNCREVWSGSCRRCPLPILEQLNLPKTRCVSYNDAYGGVVDLTAARTQWADDVPAFVLTAVPRRDSGGYTYRKILFVDLELDRCDVLKSDPEGWQPGEGSFSQQMENFARSGAVHPEDLERFIAFTKIENLCAVPPTESDTLTFIYRRRSTDSYRWNLMEVIADPGIPSKAVILCIKDVHNVLREGLEREGVAVRDRELIRSLGDCNFSIYAVNLDSGAVDPIRVDGKMRSHITLETLPWNELMRLHIRDRLHQDYVDEFQQRFSLDGLRRARDEGLPKTELLCQWRSGGDYRYISVTAHFNREKNPKNYSILALQDVDDRMRKELAHSKRDMQIAAILKARFNTMHTVHLDSGQYECIDWNRSAEPENVLTGDYAQHIQDMLQNIVHPDDAELFWTSLCLEHLRERAKSVENYAEEVCFYRQQGEPVRWMELRVNYSRQTDHVMVNILGQDVTREKRQEESRLQALEERAYVISSLSSLFFATYYIDIETDTFRAVSQLRRVGDVLGEEVDCNSALQIYAHHFIHPEDRAEYLETMNVQNLKATLRWWKPYVAIEYRKMPDSPDSSAWSRVRATAILARTGSDDMPRTVVYVAQDITDIKPKTNAAPSRPN